MSITQQLTDELYMTLYGEILKDFPEFRQPDSEGTRFPVRVYGIRSLGRCHTLPDPKILFLTGEGIELKEPECGWKNPLRKWIADPKLTTASLEIATGELEVLVHPMTAHHPPPPVKTVSVGPNDPPHFITITNPNIRVTTNCVPAQLGSQYCTHGQLRRPGTPIIAYDFPQSGTYSVQPGGYDFVGVGSGAEPINPGFPEATITYQ